MDFISIATAAEAAATHTEAGTGIIGMFGISWKLFLAQLVNFTVVLFILWKWVFTPVTTALQKRTAKIEESLKTAESMQRQKAAFEKWKQAEIIKARQQALDIVREAKSEAHIQREEVLTHAKLEHQALLEKGRQRLGTEEQKMIHDAKGMLAQLVVEATRRVLKQKMTTQKDKQLAEDALLLLQEKK